MCWGLGGVWRLPRLALQLRACAQLLGAMLQELGVNARFAQKSGCYMSMFKADSWKHLHVRIGLDCLCYVWSMLKIWFLKTRASEKEWLAKRTIAILQCSRKAIEGQLPFGCSWCAERYTDGSKSSHVFMDNCSGQCPESLLWRALDRAQVGQKAFVCSRTPAQSNSSKALFGAHLPEKMARCANYCNSAALAKCNCGAAAFELQQVYRGYAYRPPGRPLARW